MVYSWHNTRGFRATNVGASINDVTSQSPGPTWTSPSIVSAELASRRLDVFALLEGGEIENCWVIQLDSLLAKEYIDRWYATSSYRIGNV